MMNCTFKVGAVLEIDGKAHRILRLFDDGRVQLETVDEAVISNVNQQELLALYTQLRMKFIKDPTEGAIKKSNEDFNRALSSFPEKISVAALRKKRYLDVILSLGKFISSPTSLVPIIGECARRFGDDAPPSTVTIYRWYKKLQRGGGDNRSLIDRFHLRGGKGCRLSQEVQSIVQQSIESIYLTSQRESAEDVYQHIVGLITIQNEKRDKSETLRAPSKSTIYRIVKGLDQYQATFARYGKHAADMQLRVSGKGPQIKRILERIEVDHSPLDLFAVDADTNLPLGRPIVTFMLDSYSKMIVGFHVGFQGTSLESVYRCLRHALLPKTYIHDRYPSIKNDWPCHGVFETLICDNGIEFHAGDLERVAFELGFHIEYCPKRKPYYKGSIERFLKTLNYKFAHRMPGTSFAHWFDRGDYDPLKHAVVKFDVLIELIHRWIIDVYGHSLHRGINAIPYHRWRESEKQHPPRLLADPRRLDISLGRTITRSISHKGIELHGGGMFYNSDVLCDIRRANKDIKKIEVRYFVEDIGHIFAIEPDTKEALYIPAVDEDYAKGLSLQQHELIKKHVRDTNNGLIDVPALARAKAEIREIISDMSVSKSSRKRQQGSKLRGIGRGDSDFLRDKNKPDAGNGQQSRHDALQSQIYERHKSKSAPSSSMTLPQPTQRVGDEVNASTPIDSETALKRLGSFLLKPFSSEEKAL